MRRLSLATRISLAIFGVAGLTLLLLYVAAARILDSVLLEREVAGIRAQSRLLVPVIQGLARTPEDLDRTLREAPGFAGREELRLEVLGPELETLYPSGIQPATAWLGYERLKDLADHGGDIGVVERLRGPGGVSSLLALTPLPEPGWLLVVSGLSDMERRREDLTTVMVLVAVLSWILVGAAGLVMLRRWVIRPVRRMTALAERVAEGDELRVLDQAATQGADELAAMGRALAAMARRLAEDRERIGRQVEELEDMNRSLETARERLVRSETLASVGSLAAGVAHEIGNPVGIIVGYLEMLLEDASDPGMRETLLKIQGATLRIDQTIRDMLNFARPAVDETEVSDVLRAAEEVLSLLRPQKRFRAVRTTLELPADLPRARIPPSRLKQVLLNLLLNAADAFDGSPGTVRVLGRALHGRVEIAVEDRGPGIPPEVLGRVFDPFFTTKDPGAGTGLGLFMAHQVMQRYNGGISVCSEPGRGTTFTLELPAEDLDA